MSISKEQILVNKQRFVELLTHLDIDVTNILMYLDSDRADYFNKAYSIYPDYAYPGSLCEHSLKLYDELMRICGDRYPGKYSEADIISVALLKDLYRAELYEPYNKNIKNEVTGQWETQLAYRAREIKPIFGDINFSSYMIARKFMPLDNDEIVEAICYSGIGCNNIETHNIRKEYPLVVLTTMAELAVSYLGGNNE